MTGSLLKWMGFRQSRTSRPGRSSTDYGRRLAIEPIEDRLLLSATGGESVSEGGTVALDGYILSAGSFASSSFDRHAIVLGGIDDAVRWDEAGADAGDEYGVPDSVPRFMEPSDDIQLETLEGERGRSGFGDFLPSTVNEPATPAPKGPKSIDLSQEDLAAPPRDQGMVDLALVARETIFAEMGSLVETADDGGTQSLRPERHFVRTETPTPDQDAGHDLSQNGAKSLHGSRGRLAAFDLAMRQDDTFDRHHGLQALDPGIDEEMPPAEATGVKLSRPAAVSPAAFSSYQPNAGDFRREPNEDTPRRAQPGEHSMPLADVSTTSPAPRISARESVADASAAAARKELSLEEPAGARAAYLDQRREKPLAPIALALAIAPFFFRRLRDSSEDSDHEQHPPRKR